MGEPFVQIKAHNAVTRLTADDELAPQLPPTAIGHQEAVAAKDLVFIPYYLRANRGGKGHMRVGLRKN